MSAVLGIHLNLDITPDAVRADFLVQLGHSDEAHISYQEALFLTENATERQFLAGKLDELASGGSQPPP